MYDHIPVDADSQLEYEMMLNQLKPRIKAASMSTLNSLPTAKMFMQVMSRLTLLQEIGSHLNAWSNQIHDLTVSNAALDKQDRVIYESMFKEARDKSQFRVLKDSNYAFQKALNVSGFYDAFDRFRTSSLSQTLSSLKRDHASEVDFCRQCLAQLDNYNTIDHTPLGSCEFAAAWGAPGKNNSAYAIWNRYMQVSPAKELRDHYFLVKLPAAKDEASELLVRSTISSRRSFTIQRILRATTTLHEAGWYMVFDTLTLRDSSLKEFYDDKNALRDHFREIGRSVLKAEGRSTRESFNDCFQYFAVPEYGTEKGRLHFHAVYFMRTLPIGSVDPNAGRRVRNYRQLDSISNLWKYGFSSPIAVRYGGDAYSRAGWLWPVDKTGKPLDSKPPLAVAYYVAKYVNKKSDFDVLRQNFKGQEQWNKTIKLQIQQLDKTLFRVRMSRSFGMSLPSMTHLKWSELIQATMLTKDSTPYPMLMKQSAKKELRNRLSSIPLFVLQDGKPETFNMLALLRTSIAQSGALSLRSFIATMIVKLTPTDISKGLQDYIDDNRLAPIPFEKQPRISGGSK